MINLENESATTRTGTRWGRGGRAAAVDTIVQSSMTRGKRKEPHMATATSNLKDKVVVITGASSGIGESTARLLANNGAKIVLGARRTNRIDALVQAITADGGSAVGLTMDVSKRAEVEALVQRAMDAHGRVDVMVNNAGIAPLAPMAALDVKDWDRMIDVNVKGLLYGVAAVLSIMQKQKSGHIVNIASVLGFKVAPGAAVYSATKSAVRAITEGLRLEHRSDNIRCTMISPGTVATEIPESSSQEAARAELRKRFEAGIPAESIASAIAYAVVQPPEVEIDEIVVRPTAQVF